MNGLTGEISTEVSISQSYTSYKLTVNCFSSIRTVLKQVKVLKIGMHKLPLAAIIFLQTKLIII